VGYTQIHSHTQAHESTRTHARRHNTHTQTHTHMRAMHENIRAHKHAPIPEYEDAPEAATPFNMHNNGSLELLHEPGHKFVIKVGSAWDKNSRQDLQQVCGVSGAYECQHLESARLKQWSALYKIKQIELQAKLLNYFLGSNKSNIKDRDSQIFGKGKVMKNGVISSITGCYGKWGQQVHSCVY